MGPPTLLGMTGVLEVSTATPTRDAALKLAESAISARLAAGGQVTGPVVSLFWHEGKFGEGEEWKVTLKTTASRYAELEQHLIENHEWTNPEVTAIRVENASTSYIEWVNRVTQTANKSG